MLPIKASFSYEILNFDRNPYDRFELKENLIFEQLNTWHKQNPALHVFSAGKSTLGRPIPAAAIGNIRRPVLFAGGCSGDDRIGVLLLLRFLHDLADPQNADFLKANSIPSYFERGGLVVLPVCHPDSFYQKAPGGQQAHARRLSFSAPEDEAKHPCRFSETAETRAILRLYRSFSFRRAVEFSLNGEKIQFLKGRHAGDSAVLGSKLVATSCGYSLQTGDDASEPGSLKDRFVALSEKEGYAIKIGRNGLIPTSELEPLYARLLQSMLLLMIL